MTGRTIYLLCGGASRRIGRDKAMLPVGEKMLLEHQIGKCGNVFDEVVLLSGQKKYPVTHRHLFDRYNDAGPLSGLLAALEDKGTEGQTSRQAAGETTAGRSGKTTAGRSGETIDKAAGKSSGKMDAKTSGKRAGETAGTVTGKTIAAAAGRTGGPESGIRVVMAVDLPGVSLDTLHRLASAHLPDGFDAMIAVPYGTEKPGSESISRSKSYQPRAFQPLLGIYHRRVTDRLHDYLSTGRRSVAGFLEQIRVDVFYVPESELQNINTESDYNRFSNRLR